MNRTLVRALARWASTTTVVVGTFCVITPGVYADDECLKDSVLNLDKPLSGIRFATKGNAVEIDGDVVTYDGSWHYRMGKLDVIRASGDKQTLCEAAAEPCPEDLSTGMIYFGAGRLEIRAHIFGQPRGVIEKTVLALEYRSGRNCWTKGNLSASNNPTSKPKKLTCHGNWSSKFLDRAIQAPWLATHEKPNPKRDYSGIVAGLKDIKKRDARDISCTASASETENDACERCQKNFTTSTPRHTDATQGL